MEFYLIRFPSGSYVTSPTDKTAESRLTFGRGKPYVFDESSLKHWRLLGNYVDDAVIEIYAKTSEKNMET